MPNIPASLSRAANQAQNYKAPAVVQTSSKVEHITSEETNQIYQNVLQHEKISHLKRLLINRKTLEDEIKHPKTPTPLTLVKTRQTVVKIIVNYSMLRAEILEDGPQGT
jgi:autonomous glycyl radical cofactor GrcA